MYIKYKIYNVNDIHVNIFIYEYMCLYAYICIPLYTFIHAELDLIINKLRSIRLAN